MAPTSVVALLLLMVAAAMSRSLPLQHGVEDCVFPLDGMQAGDQCKARWKEVRAVLRPTQLTVGFSLVQYKMEHHYGSQDDAQKYLDGKPVPMVIGPFNAPYIIDHHHTLCALDLSEHTKVDITLSVTCDLSGLDESEFWNEMERRNYTYLLGRSPASPNAPPKPITPSDLPTTIAHSVDGSSFVDDPWRSLAGLVEQVQSKDCPNDDKECQRGFQVVCTASGQGIPFSQYGWAYFMNEGALMNQTMWDQASQAQQFVAAYASLNVPAQPSNSDTKRWMDAASLIIPLCRGTVAGKYILPSGLGILTGTKLSGYVPADQQVPKDEQCKLPSCM